MSAAATAAPPRPARAPGNGRFRAARKRMLIVVNPYATTVSDRLKNLVVYALQGRYDVEAVSTRAQNHATEICREARIGDFDIVVAFGGDGTLNEVANGLHGTGIPVSVLPGGSTNVVARTLGIPNDVVDATEHLLGLADDFRPRRVDLGIAGGRRFVFACGAGLDATAAQRVDAHPKLKARGGRWFYTWTAISGFARDYVRDPIRMRLTTPDGDAEGITTVIQNSDPFTYFGDREVRVCEGVAIDGGTLSAAVLRRANLRDMPTIAGRVLIESLQLPGHRAVSHFSGLTSARLESVSRDRGGEIRAMPVHVDGDYIGHRTELELGIDPGALAVVA